MKVAPHGGNRGTSRVAITPREADNRRHTAKQGVTLVQFARHRWFGAWALAAALILGTVAQAQVAEAPPERDWFISQVLATLGAPDTEDMDGPTNYGFAIGYDVAENVSAELAYTSWVADRGDASTTWLSGLYWLAERERLKPHIVFGGGRTSYEPDADDNNSRSQLFAGIGLLGKLGNGLYWRSDIRAVKTFGAGGIDPYAQVGFTLRIGESRFVPPPDTDGDGVPDHRDDCPTNTAAEISGGVTERGCPVDSDGDGVPDYRDDCPNSTPAEVSGGVNERGCTVDTDGDGVPDHRDECANTVPGAEVYDNGCSVLPEEVIIFTVLFDIDSAEIRGDQMEMLRDGARELGRYPTAKAVIEGHADDTGSKEYNQGLSERRAAAVRDFLVSQGLDAGRFDVVGHGETRPVADNDTAEGRRENRRAITMTIELAP